MKTKIFTPFGVMLAATICASTFQTSYAQQPPRLTAVAAYYYQDASTGFYPQDSTYYKYDLPNAYNATKKAWLYEAEIKNVYNDVTGSFDVDREAYYYAYDNNGNTTAKIDMVHYTKWDTSYQTYTTYNINNQKTTDIFKGKITSTWETWKDTYTYDGSNNLTEKLEQKLDDATGTWMNLARETYTYSGSQKTADIHFTWYNSQWQSQTRTVYHYKGSLTDTVYNEYYDATTGNGSAYQLITMTYTANNDMDTLSYFDWQSGSWVGDKRYSQTFDNNHNMLTYTRQAWFSNTWNMNNQDSTVYNKANLPVVVYSELEWNDVTGKFEIGDYAERRNFYYIDPTLVKDIKSKSSDLTIFPNPASSTLTIQLQNRSAQIASFIIYDAMGKAVKHWTEPISGLYNQTIDVSNLPQGQYLLRTSADQFASQKFTILRYK